MSILSDHGTIERNSILLVILSLIVVSIGGLVQLVPLFFMESTIEKVAGIRPYTPLELAGFDIYIREGCYVCHSQQIRTLRDEVDRYGHYSLAAESMYDHPFQWGSKRNGPDLARVGGKYSDEWHAAHMKDPRSLVPESIMPPYSWMANRPLNGGEMGQHLKTLKLVGVPYSPDMIAAAEQDFLAQVSPNGDSAGLLSRYPGAVIHAPVNGGTEVTELDALVAYLQMLGTTADLKSYDEIANQR
jgi:cytochrome c oxidase cbb3-type subunit 2